MKEKMVDYVCFCKKNIMVFKLNHRHGMLDYNFFVLPFETVFEKFIEDPEVNIDQIYSIC